MREEKRTWTSWDDKAELSAPRNPRFLRPELFPRFKGIGRETHSGDAPKQTGGGLQRVVVVVLRQAGLVSRLAISCRFLCFPLIVERF